MKYKVKYNDDGVKIDAILRIKDDSFVVTYIDYVVNVHYEDIENITYNNNTLKISENGNEHVIYCSEDVYIEIESKCNCTDFDYEEQIQDEIDFESERRITKETKKSKTYKAIIFLPDGQSECNLLLTNEDIVIDDGIDTLRIPISAIIRVILEDNNNIKVLSNGNKNIVIKSDNYKTIYTELKKLKAKTPHNSNSSIIVKDAFGNDLMQSENNKKKSSGLKKFVLMVVIIGAIALFISQANSDNPAETEDNIENPSYDYYYFSYQCAKEVANRYNIKGCSSFEKFLVDEEGYIYKCGYNGNINIRVINGWYDISGTSISGSC